MPIPPPWLLVDGQKVAGGRIEHTQAALPRARPRYRPPWPVSGASGPAEPGDEAAALGVVGVEAERGLERGARLLATAGAQ